MFFVDFDAQRFEEFQILITDLQLRIGGHSGDERSLVWRLFALLAHADRRFQDQENVIATLFNAGHNFRNLLGVRQRFVNRVAELFHELLELWIH